MKKFIICRGIPGSGKSTFAKQWVLEDPEHRIRLNRDDVRNMLGKYWVPKREPLISVGLEAILKEAMNSSYDIIIDDMNLSSITIKKYKNLVKEFNKNNEFNYEIEFKDFFVPLEVCIERDSKREHPIGKEIIRSLYEKYKYIINE